MQPPPVPSPPPAALSAPARKRTRTWVIVLAVASTLVGMAALFGGAVAALVFLNKPLEVTDADREVVVTVEDLAARVEGFEPEPGVWKLTKQRGLDGVVELRSEYDQSAAGMYLVSTVTLEKNVPEARISYNAMKVGGSIGFALNADGKTKFEERDDLFSWGDESHSALITYEGRPVGNFFLGRKGSRIVMLTVAGVAFTSQETLADLLQPKLERLSSYRATPAKAATAAP